MSIYELEVTHDDDVVHISQQALTTLNPDRCESCYGAETAELK